ncbi:glycerol-3-phosphate 1-O-acyltransferase, putative [Hepatocystis sp. ex Piliocolobus tephrosceles]|nr:glycerol-3-phosphate 1-O-acyltransferase, putative [Hepatocystis sp. ex Piliocolobus tephrosceles]
MYSYGCSFITILLLIIPQTIITVNLKNKSFYYIKNNLFTYEHNNKFRHKNKVKKKIIYNITINNIDNSQKHTTKLCNVYYDYTKTNDLISKINTYEEAYDAIYAELEKKKKEHLDYIDNLNTFDGFLKQYYKEIKKHKTCTPQTFVYNYLTFFNAFKKYRNYIFDNLHKYDLSLYNWSLDFWLPLINQKASKFIGIPNITKIKNWLKNNENVFILSNHHIETDANIIKMFFHTNNAEDIAKNIIFIGGHKIRNDPLSKPFSVATNLLCIYSKKYIDYPPHLKEEKTAFNLKSLNTLNNLLSKGKQIIWFAPHGGRDRKRTNESIPIGSFDKKIIQMFLIFAKRSKIKTHFVGMALNTYNICPPPNSIDVDEIEKQRTCSYSPIGINLGEDMLEIYSEKNKNDITTNFYNYVNNLYKQII